MTLGRLMAIILRYFAIAVVFGATTLNYLKVDS